MMQPVYISPSAQEHNIGYEGYGSEERVMNLIADVVCALLTYNGVPWVRNKPEMTLAQIIADSNSKMVCLHVAIHSNAGGGRGAEVYHDARSNRGKTLAQSIYDELEPITPAKDRGGKGTTALSELTKTKAPAALAEVSFHDNLEDAMWILNNITNIGEAIAK